MTDAQVKQIADALKSVSASVYLAGFFVYIGLMFNACNGIVK